MKFLIPFLSLLISSVGLAQSTRSNAFEDYKGETWAITFGASYTSTVLRHDESSSNGEYVTAGEKIRVPDVKLSLTLMKELFNPNKYSVTLLATGGMSDASGSPSDENAEDYTEELSAVHYGGGLTVNYNTYAYGLKLQPYVGALILLEQGEHNLTHDDLNTIHEFEATVAYLNVGIRCFDADHNLMSFFQISAPQVMSETITPYGQVDGSDITITSNTEITRDPVAFTLGFGYYF